MTYATAADLESRVGKQELIVLAPNDQDPSEYDLTKVNAALTDATAEIDTYLSGVLKNLVDPKPVALVRRCCDLSRYFLMDDRPTDQAEKRHEEAIEFLKAAAKGDIHLGEEKASGLSEAKAVVTKTRANRIFTADTLSEF